MTAAALVMKQALILALVQMSRIGWKIQTVIEDMILLPKGFGGYWMSRDAADLCRIAVAFGGYDADELTSRLIARDLARPRHRGAERALNIRTVERVLAEMRSA